MSGKNKNNADTQPAAQATASSTVKWLRDNGPLLVIGLLLCALFVYYMSTRTGTAPGAQPRRVLYPETVEDAPLRPFRVVNAHEHLMERRFLPKYFQACDETGIVNTLFVASSEFTMRGSKADPRKGNAENSNEMNLAAAANPGRIIPFCTIHPAEPDTLEKIKTAVAGGARGLKLYTGHGNFYERPLDNPAMEPVYAYCEETQLPVCWHVNCTKYLAEFERVLKAHPRMIVICPHFGVTFFRPRSKDWQEFSRLMATYPNLYTDTSFGTREILVSGLEAVNRDPEPFREFFRKFGDRVLFGTDMVITGNKEKTTEWIAGVIRACRNVLERQSYYFDWGVKGSKYAPASSTNVNGYYWGLALDDDTLRKVYETNILKILPPK